jgi:hypothetical protein
MEHTDILKIEINYGRAGSFVCHYAANDVVRCTAQFPVKAWIVALSTADRPTLSVGMQERYCDLVYKYRIGFRMKLYMLYVATRKSKMKRIRRKIHKAKFHSLYSTLNINCVDKQRRMVTCMTYRNQTYTL